jgi:REP element-mobilizing transposase RayT
MPYNPERHHRRSIRLPGYDYRHPGGYFVTICTYKREVIFGAVRGGIMIPNPYGEATAERWRAIPRHTARAALDAFVLMPNHLHGIIILNGEVPEWSPEGSEPHGTVPGSIPAIIQSFKSVSTRAINQMRGTPGARVWQEDYYERVIRNAVEMNRIRQYIIANPARWRQ